MKRLPGFILFLLLVASAALGAERLRVAVVQLAESPSLAATRDHMVEWIDRAAEQKVRVVVFPEGALDVPAGTSEAEKNAAIDALRAAARRHHVYVLTGMDAPLGASGKSVNSVQVLGPEGQDVFSYTKLYNVNTAKMPGTFLIDGVKCSAMICADRWLRGVEEVPIQEGAQISFELACNLAVEWVPAYQWYWYVPRALRNNAWVVFSNSANRPGDAAKHRHGHGAIIAPDGRLVAGSREDTEAMTIGEIDVSEATLAEARARASNPVLKQFWAAGVKLQQGESVPAPALAPLKSPQVEVTLAVAQVAGDLPRMIEVIREAHTKHADLVAFPAASAQESDLPALQAAARAESITVVVGAEHTEGGAKRNSAFVIGPEGTLFTRYDQLSASAPYQAGTQPGAMWFTVKGVPAVVTLGRDALWTEIAELASVAGARVIVHLDHDAHMAEADRLRRLQVWSNHASYLTFTAMANVVDSVIWDDLRGMEEISAEYKGRPRPDSGAVEVFSPWSANLVARATETSPLIVATRKIPSATNPHHPNQTSRYNPQMEPWYRIGAALIHPQ